MYIYVCVICWTGIMGGPDEYLTLRVTLEKAGLIKTENSNEYKYIHKCSKLISWIYIYIYMVALFVEQV